MSEFTITKSVPATELMKDDRIKIGDVYCRVTRMYDMRVYVALDVESEDRTITADIRVAPNVTFDIYNQ